uniref:Uncharacterized protein n=1 Tax=Phlebotomus papatasi TaxID=29031 RepID=A0A1B0CZZ6_PHLPP
MKKYRKRACRSTRDQHSAFVEYIEKRPCVLDPTHSAYERVWDELTTILNARGPRRTSDQWQTNLRDWRYATAFKYKRAKKMGIWNLTEVEEKFLKITGRMPRDSKDKNLVILSSDDDTQPPKLELSTEVEDEEEVGDETPVLMEVTQSPQREEFEESGAENPDISSVWFPENKKEIMIDVTEEGEDVLKQPQSQKQVLTSPKQFICNPMRKWTEQEVSCLISYIKSTLWDFEKPKPDVYYRRFLSMYPSISFDVGMKWSIVKGKITFLRQQYGQAKAWLKGTFGMDLPFKSLSVKAQVPGKIADGDSNSKMPGSDLKITLPPQITVRNLKTKQVLSKSLIPSSSRTEILQESPSNASKELQEEKLDLEIRRFELEKRRYEHEKYMNRQRFLFESDMRKKEQELRKLELENERLEVEKMVEIERLRLRQEERVERFKIEMEYELKE